MAVVVARLALAAALLVGLVTSLVSRSPGPSGPIDFLAYFITQVVLLEIVALVTASVVLLRERETPPWVVALRGATVTYALVLAAARLLIAAPWQPSGGFPVPVANVLLTLVAPLLLLLDWLAVGDRRPLTHSFLRWIAAYPVLWSALTLIRGIQTGWTPYPLLDPAVAGARMPAYFIATVLLALAAGAITSSLSRERPWLLVGGEPEDVPEVTRLIPGPPAPPPGDLPGPTDVPKPAVEPPEDQGRV